MLSTGSFDYYSFLFTDADYIRVKISKGQGRLSAVYFEITPVFEISLSVQADTKL